MFVFACRDHRCQLSSAVIVFYFLLPGNIFSFLISNLVSILFFIGPGHALMSMVVTTITVYFLWCFTVTFIAKLRTSILIFSYRHQCHCPSTPSALYRVTMFIFLTHSRASRQTYGLSVWPFIVSLCVQPVFSTCVYFGIITLPAIVNYQTITD